MKVNPSNKFIKKYQQTAGTDKKFPIELNIANLG